MIRSERIRYKILRNGAEYAEIFPGDSAPTLRMSSGGEIKMSMEGSFLGGAIDTQGREAEIDWMTDEIKPVLEINGVPKPLSVLMPAKVTPKENRGVTTLEIQAFDRCWRVRDTKVEGSINLPAGTPYLDAVEQLLASAGIGTIIKTPSTATLTEDREDWQTGTSYLSIINDLLGEINYKQLWFNSEGSAMLEPASVPDAAHIQHILTDQVPDPRNSREAGLIRVYPTFSKETDVYNAPNVFICVCSNADKSGDMKATAVNENPQSPLSVQRRNNRRIVQSVYVNNIASQAELQAYADRMLNDSMMTGETIQVETLLLQGFGVEDVTALQYGDELSICRETGWTMQLTPGGKMNHTLEKVVLNLG